MAKKKQDEVIENEGIEMTPEIVEVTPIAKVETSELMPNGYVQIKPIGAVSEGVIVKAKYFGTIYSDKEWEIVSTKKK